MIESVLHNVLKCCSLWTLGITHSTDFYTVFLYSAYSYRLNWLCKSGIEQSCCGVVLKLWYLCRETNSLTIGSRRHLLMNLEPINSILSVIETKLEILGKGVSGSHRPSTELVLVFFLNPKRTEGRIHSRGIWTQKLETEEMSLRKCPAWYRLTARGLRTGNNLFF